MKCFRVGGVAMTKIVDHIFIGVVDEVRLAQQSGFSILGACKNPLHRQHAKLSGASEEGYVGKAMPKDEPEYLFAERDHALYLNLIDARDVNYIPDEVINKALEFIDKEIADGRDVLIACNKAQSRSPSIALMWMMKSGKYDGILQNGIFTEIYFDFSLRVYLDYNPSNGMKEYVRKFWEKCKYGKV